MRCAKPSIATVAAASLVAGCGIANPYDHQSSHAPKQTQSTDAHAPRTPMLDVTVRAALGRYALLTINWTSTTLASHQRQLAKLAVDGARAQALQTAASYGTGSSLQQSRVANHGQITSIAAGQGSRQGWWLITTEEKTTGSGDYAGQPAQAHLYAARLSHTVHGWKVSEWSPQN